MKCVAQFHHPLGLLGALCGHRARKVATIVGYHPDGQTIQARQANDLTVTIIGGYLKERLEVQLRAGSPHAFQTESGRPLE